MARSENGLDRGLDQAGFPRAQSAWAVSLPWPGASTNDPTDRILVDLSFPRGSTAVVEVSFDGPDRVSREDLLCKADLQLQRGRDKGMRCFFLGEVLDEDRDQAFRWLPDRLGDGSAYPNIDAGYVGWPDTLDSSGSTWVYHPAWKRD